MVTQQRTWWITRPHWRAAGNGVEGIMQTNRMQHNAKLAVVPGQLVLLDNDLCVHRRSTFQSRPVCLPRVPSSEDMQSTVSGGGACHRWQLSTDRYEWMNTGTARPAEVARISTGQRFRPRCEAVQNKGADAVVDGTTMGSLQEFERGPGCWGGGGWDKPLLEGRDGVQRDAAAQSRERHSLPGHTRRRTSPIGRGGRSSELRLSRAPPALLTAVGCNEQHLS